ncbi:Hypothetical_protein [Hexamita inflata]|uniref:Hypothetical_protein n=1 Tax=Hexamita inflata TaxID=28002 RepID=A0AA86UKE5_9EUKA|nr:Hypothetical protein HINF_LOCUS42287 [Hexamita inflata]
MSFVVVLLIPLQCRKAIDELKKICKQIDQLDFQLKEQRHHNNDQTVHNQIIAEIKIFSKQFMEEASKGADIVEKFYFEQVEKIQTQNEEITILTKRALQIKLQKEKCKAIVEKNVARSRKNLNVAELYHLQLRGAEKIINIAQRIFV